MSFYYSRKICSFPKGLINDSGQIFQISFEPFFLQKRPRFCRLMMSFSQNEYFWTIKVSFHYSRKICIFSKGLTQDSCQKFQLSLAPTFL